MPKSNPSDSVNNASEQKPASMKDRATGGGTASSTNSNGTGTFTDIPPSSSSNEEGMGSRAWQKFRKLTGL